MDEQIIRRKDDTCTVSLLKRSLMDAHHGVASPEMESRPVPVGYGARSDQPRPAAAG
jgi:hypothetical protein